MTLRYLLLSILVLGGNFCLWSQTHKTGRELTAEDYKHLRSASQSIDADRYEGIRGKPYLYKTFRAAHLYDVGANVYSLDSVNFNGYSHKFEYKLQGEWREINPLNFMRGEMVDDEGLQQVFTYNINPKFPNKYAELIFKGDNIITMIIHDMVVDEKIVQDVGRTLKLKRFNRKPLYYAIVDGEQKSLRLNAKKLSSELGHKTAIMKYIKTNKLKATTREDLIKILTFADELF